MHKPIQRVSDFRVLMPPEVGLRDCFLFYFFFWGGGGTCSKSPDGTTGSVITL